MMRLKVRLSSGDKIGERFRRLYCGLVERVHHDCNRVKRSVFRPLLVI